MQFSKHTARYLMALPVAIVFAALGGCASPMVHQEITPVGLHLAQPHPQSVSVAVLAAPNADAAKAAATIGEMRIALVDAINASKAFGKIAQDGGDYQLTVQVFSESHPAFGISFTSQVELGWTLKRVDTGAVAWQKSIITKHTVGATEAFSGAERAKMAMTGALKDNFAEGLTQIGALSL